MSLSAESQRCAIKICGITNIEDAKLCETLGVESIGINFYPRSPRYCAPADAKAIVEALGDAMWIVGVFVDANVDDVTRIRDEVGLDCVQLHGYETSEYMQALLPHAYKAIRVRSETSLELARAYPGDYLLVDGYEPGVPGGTGQPFEWRLAHDLARERKVIVAGGLTPSNVVQAIEATRPFAVDVASGVESQPGKKDAQLLRDFVSAVRR